MDDSNSYVSFHDADEILKGMGMFEYMPPVFVFFVKNNLTGKWSLDRVCLSRSRAKMVTAWLEHTALAFNLTVKFMQIEHRPSSLEERQKWVRHEKAFTC